MKVIKHKFAFSALPINSVHRLKNGKLGTKINTDFTDFHRLKILNGNNP